jgi:hypothetical protein
VLRRQLPFRVMLIQEPILTATSPILNDEVIPLINRENTFDDE